MVVALDHSYFGAFALVLTCTLQPGGSAVRQLAVINQCYCVSARQIDSKPRPTASLVLDLC